MADKDGTKERKDTSSGKAGQSSSETKGTSKDKGKLYTDADIVKMKSDAAAEAGRLRKAAELERDMVRREGLLKADRADVDKDRGVVSVAYIAAKHGLKVEDLEDLGVTDPEALEKIAVKLEGTVSKGEDDKGDKGDKGDEGDKGGESLKIDSGESGGSGGKTDQEKLNERYPTMASK